MAITVGDFIKLSSHLYALGSSSLQFSIVTDAGSWPDSRDRCVELGMMLAIIKDADTFNAAEDYLTSIGYT